MLGLESATPVAWVRQVEVHLDEVLIDHAHCEKKAAGVAMNLIFSYVTDEALVRELSRLAREELEHLALVLDELAARGLAVRRQQPSRYGARLLELVRRGEPDRLVDRCLVAALIEARSCERFALLRDHLADPRLAAFYGSLLESEARHHGAYVRLAELRAPKGDVRGRLRELARAEAAILARGDDVVRLHS